MTIRQLFELQSSTYTYLVVDEKTKMGVLIDPVYETHLRDLALIRELGITLVATLETHVHADHVTGAWLMHTTLSSSIVLSARAGASGAHTAVKHGDRISFGGRFLTVRETPGHTSGCLTYVLDDETAAFTGDALLVRGTGRTDFQQGDAATLFHSIHEQIFSLPNSCVIYPGHDYAGRCSTTVWEEKNFNPRCALNVDLGDFVGYQSALSLPHPKQIDVAVPANLKCGEPVDGKRPPSGPSFAPLSRTYGGVWEIAPQDAYTHMQEATLVDVRRREEFEGDLGVIDGVMKIELTSLEQRMKEIPDDKPVIFVCRSGARSAQATVLAARAGRNDVVNLAGGMLRWNTERLPVIRVGQRGHA